MRLLLILLCLFASCTPRVYQQPPDLTSAIDNSVRAAAHERIMLDVRYLLLVRGEQEGAGDVRIEGDLVTWAVAVVEVKQGLETVTRRIVFKWDAEQDDWICPEILYRQQNKFRVPLPEIRVRKAHVATCPYPDCGHKHKTGMLYGQLLLCPECRSYFVEDGTNNLEDIYLP